MLERKSKTDINLYFVLEMQYSMVTNIQSLLLYQQITIFKTAFPFQIYWILQPVSRIEFRRCDATFNHMLYYSQGFKMKIVHNVRSMSVTQRYNSIIFAAHERKKGKDWASSVLIYWCVRRVYFANIVDHMGIQDPSIRKG